MTVGAFRDFRLTPMLHMYEKPRSTNEKKEPTRSASRRFVAGLLVTQGQAPFGGGAHNIVRSRPARAKTRPPEGGLLLERIRNQPTTNGRAGTALISKPRGAAFDGLVRPAALTLRSEMESRRTRAFKSLVRPAALSFRSQMPPDRTSTRDCHRMAPATGASPPSWSTPLCSLRGARE